MKFFYLFVILLPFTVIAQHTANNQIPYEFDHAEVLSAERKVVFIDLRKKPNSAFSISGQRVTKYIYNALEAEKIQAYQVNYNQNTYVPLNKKQWLERLKLPWIAGVIYEYLKPSPLGARYETFHYYRDGSIDTKQKALLFGKDSANWKRRDSTYYGDERFTAVDFNRLGLDQTSYVTSNGTFHKVHFVNFYGYDYENNAVTIENPRYYFSVTWEDFIKTIEESNSLYYGNSYRSWWRGNIFVTDNRSMDQYGLDYLEIMRVRKDFVPYSFTKPVVPMDIMDYTKPDVLDNGDRYYDSKFYDLFSLEKSSGDTSSLFEIGMDELTIEYKQTGKKIVFLWNDFLKVAQDSAWYKNSYLSIVADVFKKGQFATDDTLAFTISRNGKFPDETVDSFYKATIHYSYPLPLPERKINNLSLLITQGIYTEESLNKSALTGKNSISNLILSYIKNNKIIAFADDTLKATITKEKVYARTIKKRQVKPYYYQWDYRKGDLVSFRGGEIGKVMKDLKANQHSKVPSPRFEEYIEKSTTPWHPDSLSYLEIIEKATFNEQGYNKKYSIEAIGIYVPMNRSQDMYVTPVCFVKWEALKKLLEQDHQEILIEFIERRQYFSYIQKTGVIKLVTP